MLVEYTTPLISYNDFTCSTPNPLSVTLKQLIQPDVSAAWISPLDANVKAGLKSDTKLILYVGKILSTYH